MFGSDLFNQLDKCHMFHEVRIQENSVHKMFNQLDLHCSSIEEPLPGGRLFNEVGPRSNEQGKRRPGWL